MELAGIIIGALSLLATAITYIIDKVLERKQRTFKELNELRNNYHDDIADADSKKEKGYFRKCLKLFGNAEQFCAGVLTGYYSMKVVKKRGSKFLNMLFTDFKEYLIDQRRKTYPDYCQHLERLVNQLNKSKKQKQIS